MERGSERQISFHPKIAKNHFVKIILQIDFGGSLHQHFFS
jgi:hypothetical protein